MDRKRTIMFYIKIIDETYEPIEYIDCKTRREALDYLDANGFVRNVVGAGRYFEYIPDIYYNAETNKRAKIFSDNQ